MKTLCLYYSRTNTTRVVMNRVVTHMAAADYEKAIRKAYGWSVAGPKAHLSVQTKNHDPEAEIKAFVRRIEQK